MKNKLVIALLVANAFIWGVFLPSNAKADDYNTAVIAHVVKETVSGKGVDTSVLEAEMHKLAYKFSLEMTSVLEKHLPYILEGIAADIRLKADNEYKCNLYKGTNYECK